jgi:radical SAM superfamily enzyme YgiQ (UPF0313 family)
MSPPLPSSSPALPAAGAQRDAAASPGEPAGSLREPGRILVISCYELGHVPHGLAMTMAFLARAGFAPRGIDLSVEGLDEEAVDRAALVVVSVPMHTALRLGVRTAQRIRRRRPDVRICFAGLYAPLNAAYLTGVGVDWVLGGESEEALVALAEALDAGREPAPSMDRDAAVHLRRLDYPRPQRQGLPSLSRYARLDRGDGELRVVGYTETTRGCLDTCRHCPVPAVYGGRFVAVPADVVEADIEALVAAGAQHITFGDPDFFNGPTHGLRILRRMHERWPALSFDITAQVTHLLRHRDHLSELVALGCELVVSAVESLSDRVLAALAKRHRRADVEELFDLCERTGLVVRPTFVTFTPWTTLDDVRGLVDFIVARRLIDHVDPVQLSIRLLVPPGSLLLDAHPGTFGPLDPAALTHAWQHEDPRMDALQARIAGRVAGAARADEDAATTFAAICALVYEAAGLSPAAAARAGADASLARARRRVPRVTEPWFC